MYEIGDTLRESRLRRGMTIKDVEDATKIRSKYLQALESDDFEVIPGPTFVKAFLRTYGEFLELDTVILLDEYRSRFEPAQELHAFPIRPKGSAAQPAAAAASPVFGIQPAQPHRHRRHRRDHRGRTGLGRVG